MSDEEPSPPTSPIYSPPTSPVQGRLAEHSPARSPVGSSFSVSSAGSSSSNASPIKHGRKRKFCRTTVQRKQRREEQCNDDDVEEEDVDLNVVIRNQDSTACDEIQGRNIGDNGGGQHRTPPSPLTDVDNTSQDSSQSDPRNSDSNSENGDSSSENDASDFSSSVPSRRSSGDSHDSESEQSDGSGETVNDLYEGSDISANEGLLKVLKLYVEERMTKECLDKNIKLIKSMLPQPNELPSSGKAALKRLEELTSTCMEKEYLYCKECLQLVVSEDNDGGDSCNHDTGRGKFYSFPIAEQIKHMFEQRGLAAAMDSYRDCGSRIDGHICDIVDGAEYKNVKRQLNNIYSIVLLWNTDGVALSSSSNQELWPILCTICEVAPHLRSSYVIVAGVYVGEKAPDMNVFLKPFADSLIVLIENPVEWVHPLSKQTFVSKIVAPVFCGDAPAKSHVLKCKSHNYKYGCVICEEKTKRITLPVQNENDPNERPRRLRRFVFADDAEPASLRTGPRMDMLGALARRRGRPRKGVVDVSVISDIPVLDRALCVCAEYMHLILLGVVKYFLLIIFTKAAGPWSLAKKLEDIDLFIMNKIKVPDFITRLPRRVKDLKYWKASELRSFLLFYSLPIFKTFEFPDNYFQHWLLLVAAVKILLQDAISDNDVNCAEIMIRAFVRDVGELYGEACYTYNVHNLLHLSLLVRRWGPLWATSAFTFETFNGFLGANVHGTKNLGIELINNIKISQSVVILENIVNTPRCPSQHKVSEVLGKKQTKQILNNEEQRAIESAGQFGVYVLHVRAKFMSKILTSRIYDVNKKRANSYIQFHSVNSTCKFGQILVFLKAEDGSLHCLVETLKVVQLQLLFHEQSRYVIKHLLPVERSNSLLVIPMDCVSSKVLKIDNYIGLRPNSYEVNL